MNVHERVARAAKVSALVEEIDRTCWDSGINPHDQAAAVAVLLSDRWQAQQWAQVAVIAGTKPPSAETIRQIVETYRRRGETARRRAS